MYNTAHTIFGVSVALMALRLLPSTDDCGSPYGTENTVSPIGTPVLANFSES